MSTRSMIAFDNGDSIDAIYCHFDGYPQHNGKILLEHWTDIESVEALLDLGDLSGLGTEIGEQHPFHSNDNNGWCTAYGRDRGETDVASKSFRTTEEAKKYYANCGAEYFYMFDGHGWMWSDRRAGWKQLTQEDCA